MLPAKEKGAYCEHCEQQVLVRQDRPNHIAHAIISLLTGGLWLPVWLGVTIRWGGWRCTWCGTTN